MDDKIIALVEIEMNQTDWRKVIKFQRDIDELHRLATYIRQNIGEDNGRAHLLNEIDSLILEIVSEMSVDAVAILERLGR